MLRRVPLAVLVALAVIGVPGESGATTITSYSDVSDTAVFVPGQSLTTPLGGPWRDIAFNFFSDLTATTPAAEGTLFLLTQEYLGSPDALDSSTPGYLAQSAQITGGIYGFDSAVILQPGTQYFFYANAAMF